MGNEAKNVGTPSQTETLINAFCEITSSSSKSEALFFLESHNFNLQSAVSTFLENTTRSSLPPSSGTAAFAGSTSDRPDSPSDSQSYSPSHSDSPSHSGSSSPSSASRSRYPCPPPPSKRQRRSSTAYNLRSSRRKNTAGGCGAVGGGGGGIHSFADLDHRHSKGSGTGSDSDEAQEYYPGGEKSGMSVQDPSKAYNVDAIFDQARRNAALEGPSNHLSNSGSRRVTGTARRLTGEVVSSVPQPPESITHTITFWSNGFTVDDGRLRRSDDPENASFLESIRKSECPKELEPTDRKTPVRVNLTRREEKYQVPKKCRAPFQGVGRTLGSTSNVAPVESTFTVLSFNAAPAPSSIQIRLADGTRMISRFNDHHTIGDIRGFIDASRPGGSRNYQLQTVGFPPKELADLDQTIEQAGLANSVVIQKL